VHVSDLSWSQRQRKPSAFAKKGDEIQVKILHIDPEKERLSLGIKQLTEDPWKDLENRIHLNDEVEGRIVNVTDFGVFVEVMDGVEGLVHVSEIDADVPKDKLTDFYRVNSLIRAKVLKIDVDERRLGLGILGIIEQAPPPEEQEALKGALHEGEAENPTDSATDSAAEEAKPDEPAAAE
jgi:small subunit ribosomal protein S1